MADELHSVTAAWTFTGWVILLVRSIGAVASGPGAGVIFALVNLERGGVET